MHVEQSGKGVSSFHTVHLTLCLHGDRKRAVRSKLCSREYTASHHDDSSGSDITDSD